MDLKRISVTAPPMLEKALGYSGACRMVAFYWTPFGDEVCYTDGIFSATGDWNGWLTYTQHRTVVPYIFEYDLGSSEEEAEHWLLLDRENREVYVGKALEVEEFLRREQGGGRKGPALLSAEDIQRLFEDAKAPRLPSDEAIWELLKARRLLHEELREWLDQHASHVIHH